jgi:hypothetical protein
MLNKILIVIAIGFFWGLPLAHSDPASGASDRIKGRIIAARVRGHVDALSKTDGQRRTLHDGDAVTEQTDIITAPGASVILVFSNGATVDIGADSNLDIEQFDQDPFAAAQKVSEMKHEPGTSTTRLNLTKGELVGKVVHLNVDRGSAFTVETPVGAAGIRGTTFRIVFRPRPGGKAYFSVTTSEGTVVFTGLTSAPVTIPAGEQIATLFDYTEPGPGNPGGAAPGAPLTFVVTKTPADEEADIEGLSQDMVTATESTVFSGNNGPNAGGSGNGDGSGSPPSSPDNAPSPPTIPAPATTPGAGGP